MAQDGQQDSVGTDPRSTSVLIFVTLVGGVLLLASIVARFLFEQDFYYGVLSLVAALCLGTPLVLRAFRDLLESRAEMNELVALAVVAAFASGEYLTSGTIAFFMTLSILVESHTALGARKTIESLVRLTPTRARKVLPDTEDEIEVDASELVPGDIVRVRPGDNIPGDGKVVDGLSSVNQANITGESLPVDKAPGDRVYSGTINDTGVLVIAIESVGADTTLGRVQDLVLQAGKTRTPVMRLMDQYAHWYTPVILMLAMILLVFTRDVDRVVSFLIIACPYSIILATPTAIVAAISAAARLGVLVKNVSDLERARFLTAILFDKTGTVTTGRLNVSRLAPTGESSAEELLRTASIATRSSKHPTAIAVCEAAARAAVGRSSDSAEEFEEVVGKGVHVGRGDDEIRVGRESWLQECGIDTSGGPEFRQPSPDYSLLYVSRGRRFLGWIGLEDRVRPDAPAAMEAFGDLGIRKLVMMTGDRASVATRVAKQLGCSDVQAELLPKEKLEVVDLLKQQGHSVAVLGDGVNDAPALAAGDLSVAMGAMGSDVAIHSASVALMNNRLNRIPFLIRLSRRTARVIAQGLVFSVVYIVVFGALSAGGQIHPVVASLLHATSSIIVVFNSARLVREGEALDESVERQPELASVPSGVVSQEAVS